MKTFKDYGTDADFIEDYFYTNADDLETGYEEHLQYMQDCPTHISYMRNSDACFFEWVAEQYYLEQEKEDDICDYQLYCC